MPPPPKSNASLRWRFAQLRATIRATPCALRSVSAQTASMADGLPMGPVGLHQNRISNVYVEAGGTWAHGGARENMGLMWDPGAAKATEHGHPFAQLRATLRATPTQPVGLKGLRAGFWRLVWQPFSPPSRPQTLLFLSSSLLEDTHRPCFETC